MSLYEISFATVVFFFSTHIWDTSGQRPLWPVGEFDMSMYDAAELCVQLEMDKSNGSSKPERKQYLPSRKNCYFFQWIYCPNIPEKIDTPCGWWVQKPCNRTRMRGGHHALKVMNPEGRKAVDPNPVGGYGPGGKPDNSPPEDGDDAGPQPPAKNSGAPTPEPPSNGGDGQPTPETNDGGDAPTPGTRSDGDDEEYPPDGGDESPLPDEVDEQPAPEQSDGDEEPVETRSDGDDEQPSPDGDDEQSPPDGDDEQPPPDEDGSPDDFNGNPNEAEGDQQSGRAAVAETKKGKDGPTGDRKFGSYKPPSKYQSMLG